MTTAVDTRDEIDDLVDWQLQTGRQTVWRMREMFEEIDDLESIEDWQMATAASRWTPQYGWVRPNEMDSIRRMLAAGKPLLAEQTWKL